MTSTFDVGDVALRVARALETAGVRYALGGSVATSLQGEPRSTNDIDFAVQLGPGQVPALVAALGPEFSVDEEALLDAIARRRSANIYFLPLVTKVDLFVRGSEPFDLSELDRCRRIVIQPGQPPISVASAEDNLLRKLKWYRQGNEVSDLQWRDILGLMRISGAKMDQAYLDRWAVELGVADLLARARLAKL
jgi:hypothetical protein